WPIIRIAKRVMDIRESIRAKAVELKLVRRPLGISMEAYSRECTAVGATSLLLQDVYKSIKEFGFSLDCLVAGVDNSGAYVFHIGDGPLLTDCSHLGYSAIGSGASQAYAALARRAHRKSATVEEVVCNLYEAKKGAEFGPWVGRTTDIGVIVY